MNEEGPPHSGFSVKLTFAFQQNSIVEKGCMKIFFNTVTTITSRCFILY